MRVAIVHDWLTGMRGGEKCLEVFCELFPDATLFTLLHNKGSVSKTIEAMKIKTSFIQNLPASAASYRNYLPLFPKAIESFDLRGFDFILSSSHCVAKGAKVPRGAMHICYCYTPMRYAWLFFQEYFGKAGIVKRKLIQQALKYLQKWDLEANEEVDFFIAISDNIKNRIKEIYGREAEVIYPPVETGRFELSAGDKGFYLIVSALVPYKRIDIAVEAFKSLGERLVIIGSGNCERDLKKIAQDSDNIEFLGWVDDAQAADYYRNCRALIFPGEEDFGIVPVEAQAAGKPVIAFARGGALETVTPDTGVFFFEQSPEALKKAVLEFQEKKDKFNPQVIRGNALRFSRETFKKKIADFIRQKLL